MIERPIPTYSSLAEAESAMQVMQSQLYILGTSGAEEDFSVVFPGGASLLCPLDHPDSSRILECLENMLLFNIRHCRSFIIQHTPLGVSHDL
jgi:hypothetical protein